MPYIKIDYNEKVIENDLDQLIAELVSESTRIYETTDDKVSIFCAPFGKHHFSVFAAEIEVRAKTAEYIKPGIDQNELRTKHLNEYEAFLHKFVLEHQLPKGVIFTITFEDWDVCVVEPERSDASN